MAPIHYTAFRRLLFLVLCSKLYLSALALKCSVCGNGNVVTAPDAIFSYPNQPSTTCGELEQAGLNGELAEVTCAFLPEIIDDLCGCESNETSSGCSVCGEGKVVTSPDAVFIFRGQPPVPCIVLEDFGVNGKIPQDECIQLPPLVEDTCKCRNATVAPTLNPSPIPAPIPAPVEPQPVSPASSFSPKPSSSDTKSPLLFPSETSSPSLPPTPSKPIPPEPSVSPLPSALDTEAPKSLPPVTSQPSMIAKATPTPTSSKPVIAPNKSPSFTGEGDDDDESNYPASADSDDSLRGDDDDGDKGVREPKVEDKNATNEYDDDDLFMHAGKKGFTGKGKNGTIHDDGSDDDDDDNDDDDDLDDSGKHAKNGSSDKDNTTGKGGKGLLVYEDDAFGGPTEKKESKEANSNQTYPCDDDAVKGMEMNETWKVHGKKGSPKKSDEMEGDDCDEQNGKGKGIGKGVDKGVGKGKGSVEDSTNGKAKGLSTEDEEGKGKGTKGEGEGGKGKGTKGEQSQVEDDSGMGKGLGKKASKKNKGADKELKKKKPKSKEKKAKLVTWNNADYEQAQRLRSRNL